MSRKDCSHVWNVHVLCVGIVLMVSLLDPRQASSQGRAGTMIGLINNTLSIYSSGKQAVGMSVHPRLSGEQASEDLWSATQVVIPAGLEASHACQLPVPTSVPSDIGICSQLLALARRPASSEDAMRPPKRASDDPRDLMQDLYRNQNDTLRKVLRLFPGVKAEATELHEQVGERFANGQYDEALTLAVRALDVSKKEQINQRQHIAVALGNLGQLCLARGQYSQVEEVYHIALGLMQSPHEEALVHDNFGSLYQVMGDYANAEKHLEKAYKFKTEGAPAERNTPSVALTLSHLASLSLEKGTAYDRAKSHLLRALEIYQQKEARAAFEPSPQPPQPKLAEIAATHSHLALLYRAKGDYTQAEHHWQKAWDTERQRLKPRHPEIAALRHQAAVLAHDKGNIAKAEQEYTAALDIWQQTLGAEHPLVATVLNNLAMLYHRKGDEVQAAAHLQRALQLRVKAFGPRHPVVALTYHNQAELLRTRGDLRCATTLYEQARAIWQQTLDATHPYLSIVENNLAGLYRARGEYGQVAPLLQKVLEQRERTLGAQHPDVATTLNNLAELHRLQGDYPSAEQRYKQALALKERVLGPHHPHVATILHNLAVLFRTAGEVEQAIALMARSTDIHEYNLHLILASGSEDQKRAYLTTLAGEANSLISLHTRSAPQNAAARALALTTGLRRKGRVLEAMTDTVAQLRRRLDPEAQQLLTDLTTVRTQLATLVLQGPGVQSVAQYDRQRTDLETKAQHLEATISARSAPFRVQTQPVTVAQVQAAIPPEAALVEIVIYQPFEPAAQIPEAQFGAARYAAYILRRDGEPAWVELGAATPIDTLVAKLRQELRHSLSPARQEQEASFSQWVLGFFRRSPDTQHPRGLQEIARELDEQVMRPIRPLLGDSRLMLLSPDGALNLIPFAVLVDEHQRFLVERFTFVYLSTGRDLLRLQTKSPYRHPPVIIADPNFNQQEASIVPQRGLQVTADTHVSLSFDRLPGTAEEAGQLQRLLPTAQVLRQEQATEAALKQVQGPWLLHVATHAFFLSDQSAAVPTARSPILAELPLSSPPSKIQNDTLPDSKPAPSVAPGVLEAGKAADNTQHSPQIVRHAVPENPLLRSGLALAGANRRPDGGDDGIHTALEATGLDLWGTQLVVLSACETGVGSIQTGEGVYGLRRALVMAGAETQVMSLWKVHDEATRDLMVEYYKQLLNQGAGRAEALRKVQLAMLRQKKWQHPYYWASFIASGAWTPLEK